jgi:hypothetical protein
MSSGVCQSTNEVAIQYVKVSNESTDAVRRKRVSRRPKERTLEEIAKLHTNKGELALYWSLYRPQYSREYVTAGIGGRMANRQLANRRIYRNLVPGAGNTRVDAGRALPGTPVIPAHHFNVRVFQIDKGPP